MSDDVTGAFLDTPPPFFSAEYHLRFLPRVVGYRLRQYRERSRAGGFRSHVQVEMPLLVVACVLLAIIGLPSAMQHGSIGGWISALLGIGGLVALMAWSIVGEWHWRRKEGHRYGYAEFMPSVFFFCLMTGGSVGLIAGGILSDRPLIGALWALPGLLVGYLVGPSAARWVHALGFMKAWFIYLTLILLVLLPLEDLLVLLIYAGR